MDIEYQDRVKHIRNEVAGIVIAMYDKDGESYLDVRGDDDRIYYHTLKKNWISVGKELDRL